MAGIDVLQMSISDAGTNERYEVTIAKRPDAIGDSFHNGGWIIIFGAGRTESGFDDPREHRCACAVSRYISDDERGGMSAGSGVVKEVAGKLGARNVAGENRDSPDFSLLWRKKALLKCSRLREFLLQPVQVSSVLTV